ncbi:MAG: hypothetical protein ABR964_09035 [Tepidisphaeraceae bacterium]|jgi:hypothetical protein
MFKWMFVSAWLLCSASAGIAQIIFEPVQYQYGTAVKFYYGGSDPATLRRGFCHGRTDLSAQLPRVYTDQLPDLNAALYGWTTADARNEAYASVARYFRKADLLLCGVVQPDGTIVVPAAAQLAVAPKLDPGAAPATATILIIPGGRPVPPPASNNVILIRQ